MSHIIRIQAWRSVLSISLEAGISSWASITMPRSPRFTSRVGLCSEMPTRTMVDSQSARPINDAADLAANDGLLRSRRGHYDASVPLPPPSLRRSLRHQCNLARQQRITACLSTNTNPLSSTKQCSSRRRSVGSQLRRLSEPSMVIVIWYEGGRRSTASGAAGSGAFRFLLFARSVD